MKVKHHVGASRKALLRAGRWAALLVAVLLASQGVASAGPAPVGLRVTEPETVAGPRGPVPGPRTSGQLDVFRKSSTGFPRSIIDPGWQPSSDWDNSTDLNNFNPSRWRTGTLNPNWYPRDGFKRQDADRGNVMAQQP